MREWTEESGWERAGEREGMGENGQESQARRGERKSGMKFGRQD